MQTTITVTQTGTLTESNGVLSTYGKIKDGIIGIEAKGKTAETIINNPGKKLVCQGNVSFTQGNATLTVQQVEVVTLTEKSSVAIVDAEIHEELKEANQQIQILEAELERCFQTMTEVNPAADSEKLSEIKTILGDFNKKTTKPTLLDKLEKINQVLCSNNYN